MATKLNIKQWAEAYTFNVVDERSLIELRNLAYQLQIPQPELPDEQLRQYILKCLNYLSQHWQQSAQIPIGRCRLAPPAKCLNESSLDGYELSQLSKEQVYYLPAGDEFYCFTAADARGILAMEAPINPYTRRILTSEELAILRTQLSYAEVEIEEYPEALAQQFGAPTPRAGPKSQQAPTLQMRVDELERILYANSPQNLDTLVSIRDIFSTFTPEQLQMLLDDRHFGHRLTSVDPALETVNYLIDKITQHDAQVERNSDYTEEQRAGYIISYHQDIVRVFKDVWTMVTQKFSTVEELQEYYREQQLELNPEAQDLEQQYTVIYDPNHYRLIRVNAESVENILYMNEMNNIVSYNRSLNESLPNFIPNFIPQLMQISVQVKELHFIDVQIPRSAGNEMQFWQAFNSRQWPELVTIIFVECSLMNIRLNAQVVPQLRILNIESNEIQTLQNMTGNFERMEEININRNPITELVNLNDQFPNLQKLQAFRCTNLQHIDLEDTNIIHLDLDASITIHLTRFKINWRTLEWLRLTYIRTATEPLQNNVLYFIDFSLAEKLKILIIYNIVLYNLTAPKTSEYLELFNNKITSIDLRAATNLKDIRINSNLLNNLTTSSALVKLELTHNTFTSINLRASTNLMHVFISRNPLLTELDFYSSNLVNIDCQNGNLKYIRFHQPVDITLLYIGNNKLSEGMLYFAADSRVRDVNINDNNINKDWISRFYELNPHMIGKIDFHI